jgi:hypothetical protein
MTGLTFCGCGVAGLAALGFPVLDSLEGMPCFLHHLRSISGFEMEVELPDLHLAPIEKLWGLADTTLKNASDWRSAPSTGIVSEHRDRPLPNIFASYWHISIRNPSKPSEIVVVKIHLPGSRWHIFERL